MSSAEYRDIGDTQRAARAEALRLGPEARAVVEAADILTAAERGGAGAR